MLLELVKQVPNQKECPKTLSNGIGLARNTLRNHHINSHPDVTKHIGSAGAVFVTEDWYNFIQIILSPGDLSPRLWSATKIVR